MELSPIITIVLAAVGGYLFGLLDRWVTQRIRKKPEKTPPPTVVEKIVEKVVEIPVEANLPGEKTLLKVTVDQAPRVHLELEGNRLEDPTRITVEQRQHLVNVIVQMRPWIDGKPAPAAPVVQPAPAPVAQPRPIPQPAPATPPQPPLPAAPLVTPSPAVSPIPAKIDLARGFRSMLNNEAKSPEALKNTSIVGMIDSVLQTKVVGTPFSGMGIRLEEGSLGEVIVYVGASRYPGIEAVPDPEVQALIRSAIADWEKK